MNTLLVIGTLLVVHVVLGYCGDNEDNYKQYDCAYMWMMMNTGPQPTGFDPFVLLLLGIGTVLLSRELMAIPWIAADGFSHSQKSTDTKQEPVEAM